MNYLRFCFITTYSVFAEKVQKRCLAINGEHICLVLLFHVAGGNEHIF